MASLYVSKGNEATVCRFHKTPSDWDYEPLSVTETRLLIDVLQAEGLATVSPASRARWATGDSALEVR